MTVQVVQKCDTEGAHVYNGTDRAAHGIITIVAGTLTAVGPRAPQVGVCFGGMKQAGY